MTLRITRSVVALAAAGLLLGATAASAVPRNVELRGDGTCAGGIDGTLSGSVRGAGIGAATVVSASTSIDVNGATDFALPNASPNGCSGADGTVTLNKSGSLLAMDVAGVVCENGVSFTGTAPAANLVFEGSYIVDGAGSTGSYAGHSGAGNAVVGCYGDGEAAYHINGSLERP